MQIAQLKVRIGDYEVSLADCTDENPDIKKLLEMATSSSAVVTIVVPQTEETASALGRLTYGVPKSDKVKMVDTDMIPQLSRHLDEVDFSVRTANCLQNRGWVYVWQVAEATEGEVLKIKDLGRKSLNEIKEIFGNMGLRLGMDLSKVKDLLPNPNPTP